MTQRHHKPMTEILDLTRPLDQNFEPFSEGSYSDPPLTVTDWCRVPRQGYWVGRLELGTQTGTHIDAPAHFLEGGATIEQLPLTRLIGRYCLIDLAGSMSAAEVAESIRGYNGEALLFVRTPQGKPSSLDAAALADLLHLPPLVWVLSGEIVVRAAPQHEFHRLLAQAGRFLVEDLDQESAARVRPGGEVFALPLRMVGTSGAPCRVVVRMN